MNARFIFIILLLIPEIASAHSFLGDGGFLSGLKHPVFGLDHLLAMVAVGILSAQMGGLAIWTVPATFVLVMTIGAGLGIYEVHIPFVENGISVSVIVLGIAIAAEKKMPVIVAMICVAIFATFHGYAHGIEMPWLVKPTLYAIGFVTATAMLHLLGVGIGVVCIRVKYGKKLLKVIGSLIAGIGIYMILQ